MAELSNTSTLETWVSAINLAYIISLSLTLILTVVSIYLNKKVSSIKDSNFALYRQSTNMTLSENEKTISQTQLQAAETNEKTEILKNNSEILKNKSDLLEQQNIQLMMNLEQEKTNVMQMQKDLAPRSLEQSMSSKKLNRFKNYTAIIRYVPDFEARRFMGMINTMVRMAGWKSKYEATKFDETIRDGVSFTALDYPLIDSTYFPTPQRYEEEKSTHKYNVSDQLLEIFKENNIDVRYDIGETHPPKNVVIITVGLKPNKFKSGVEGNVKDNMTY
jgi:hypothetical protein